jgi:hypothetical protein
LAALGVDAPDAAADTFAAACVVGVEDAVGAPSEAGRVHARAAAERSRNRRGKVVIDL